MSQVRAKFVVGTKMALPDGGTNIYMYPVYSSDPASENKAFSDSTPAGVLQMTIAKDKPAADSFVTGKAYYVDISPAD